MADIDPDVEAAFSGQTSGQQPYAGSKDSDVEAAFNPGVGSSVPKGGFMLRPDPNVSRQTDQPTEPGTPIGPAISKYNQWAGDQNVREYSLGGLINLSPDTQRDLRNAPAAIEMVAGAAKDASRRAVPKADAPVGSHPLAYMANSERAELQSHADALEGAGVKLPPRELTPQQEWVNNQAAADLKLPHGAPITDGMIDAGKKQYVSPAYEAAKAVPEYNLGPQYQNAIGKVDLSKIDPEFRPMTSGKMDGAAAVELSGQLRSVARGLNEDADNPNLTYAVRQEARATAKAHYDAAKAVEAGFREGSGQTQIADNWDAARVYNAKAEAWRGSIDGAGNVAAPKIKRLLGDEPITGPMKTVASAAAQYPDLFKSTRLNVPKESAFKKGAKVLAPALGAAAAEAIVPGSTTVAPMLGALAGKGLVGH